MKWEEMVREWEPLGEIPPAGLLESRLKAHWAVQVVASFGTTCIAPRPDDSHTSMRWLPVARLLAGERAENGLQIGLDIEKMALVSLDENGELAAVYPLHGRTLDDAYRWLADLLQVSAVGGPSSIRRPTYEMPPHPTGAGARFELSDGESLKELARWYANAARIFRTVAGENPDASPVRCWPHRFDISTLIVFDPDEPDADKARSINVGMSPGDSDYAEPYFYVSPWPRPHVVQPPELDGEGTWHTDSWFGAVLPAERIATGTGARDQAGQVGAFVASALTAARALLDL